MLFFNNQNQQVFLPPQPLTLLRLSDFWCTQSIGLYRLGFSINHLA